MNSGGNFFLALDAHRPTRSRGIVDAVVDLLSKLRLDEIPSPVDYCEATVNLAADKTSSASGLIDVRGVTPYLVEPISAFARRGRYRLTIQAVEQTAKSTSWKLGAMWRLRYMPSPTGIIYQNEDVGRKIIKDSFLPMLRCDQYFFDALPERSNENPRTLDVPKAPTYLMTGDGAIISIPLGLVVGDEINKWRQEKANRKRKRISADDDYQVSKLRDMDKRTRTFSDSLRVLVCSPEGRKSPITTEFEQSSMGFYFLRCRGCGELTFNTTLPEEYFVYDAPEKVVAPATIALVCPECGYRHAEADKKFLTTLGGYIHEHPERLSYHAGFCWGALASQFPGVDWLEICQSIENAKNSNSYEAHAYLCNSIKGLPFTPQVVTGEKISIVRTHHAPGVSAERFFSAVYMGVDTQEVGYWFAIMAVDAQENWYTLDYGFAWDDDAVVEAWNREYCGVQPMAGIIDEGGHRKPDVDHLLTRLGSGFFKYKGEGGNYKDPFRVSEQDPFLILGQARRYQSRLLYLIYSQHRTDSAYWYIDCDIKKTLVFQMVSVQPPPNEPDADFCDWSPFERQHDLFDAHKMILCLHDFAMAKFRHGFFRLAPGEPPPPPAVIVNR